jgi:hypothetical protein
MGSMYGTHPSGGWRWPGPTGEDRLAHPGTHGPRPHDPPALPAGPPVRLTDKGGRTRYDIVIMRGLPPEYLGGCER